MIEFDFSFELMIAQSSTLPYYPKYLENVCSQHKKHLHADGIAHHERRCSSDQVEYLVVLYKTFARGRHRAP